MLPILVLITSSVGSKKLLWSTIIGLVSVIFINLKINDKNVCIFYVNNAFKILTSKLNNEITKSHYSTLENSHSL